MDRDEMKSKGNTVSDVPQPASFSSCGQQFYKPSDQQTENEKDQRHNGQNSGDDEDVTMFVVAVMTVIKTERSDFP